MTIPTPNQSDEPTGEQAVSYFEHDWTNTESLVEKIVSGVADVTGKDETEIELLYDQLNPESLDTLFRRSAADRDRSDGLLVFTLEGCTVTVYGSGVVIIQG